MSSKVEYREEAIPFVIYNPEKRLFEINDEAFDFLKQLQGPLGIISVAGMYRTGKSYLLNRMLLNRSGGFGVGPTINPCTKGIWIWGKPIQGFTPEGEPINVIVIDTEGLGALDEDSNHDVRIFSIAILISSYFLYNSVGSIDENALSQLSLVINLTKHIHLKSTGLQEDIDPEEYSQYFPSFMWVVRDFALQLMDLEGEQITPKEYLEKALQPQKGFTDAVEQKNRIRRLLKSFFQERDCCTMIRPLTKEENLQSLEKMALEELRPEFVEQVMTLRRKVLNRIRPKIMHGKKLNGEMLFNLALSYVDAINKGVVPNIETAWSYICKNECQKALQEAQDKFEKSLIDKFSDNQPVFDDELKEMYQEAKKIALEDFSKVAVGEIQKEYLNGLKEKMRNKYQQIRNENTKISEQSALIFLQQNYQQIERKLKNQEYQSIYDLVEELKNFQLYFIDNGPPGPNRMTVLMDFINKSLVEASEFIFRHQENELRIQKTINQDTIIKLQSSLQEVKDENRSKIDSLENKVRNNEMDKADLSAKEQSTREALSQKIKDFQQFEMETQERIDQLKKDNQRQLEECRNMVYQSEEHSKEVQRQRMAMESEGDKQRALQDQRIEFLEKQIEEYSKKEKELNNEVKNQKRDYMSTQKDAQRMYEQQIKDLNKKFEDVNEKVFDWENKYQELEQKYDQDVQKLEDIDTIQKKDIAKLKDSYQELQKQFDTLKKKYQVEVEQLQLNSEEDRQNKSEKIVELDSKVKQLEEQSDITRQKWEKDQAIYRQKQEFLELQLKEERTKYEQQRHDHEQMLSKINSRERESVIGKEDSQKRLQALQEQLNREMQDMEQKYETQKVKMQHQIDQLIDRNQELEISLKIQVGDFEKEVSVLREQLHNSEEQKMKAQDLIKNLDAQKLRILEDNENRHKEREGFLEKELEEKNKEFESSFKEVQEKSEEQLAQLKNFYEIEKDRLERRLQEEKDRAQKRYNVMVDDYEQKLKDEIQQKDEEIELTQEESHQKEAQLNELISQLQHENSLRIQQIDSLEAYLQETKESLNNMQSTSSVTLEKQLEKFNEERKDAQNKIDKLQQDITRKERVITTLENQKESFSSQLAQKDKTIQDLRSDTNSEKNDMSNKIEQIRTKHQEVLDELTQKRIDFERDKALKSQQLQFQEQRINELAKQLEDTIRRYEERIKQDREDFQKDMHDKIQRIQSEKDASDLKYEQKRKALKDLESNMNKQLTQIDRERAVMLEKYQNLEVQQKELIKNYESEIIKLRETNDQLSSTLTSDKQSIHQEVERWRNQFLEMERQFQDQNNNYDKDKALWEGKFKFLEQQKETAKKDLEDAQKKFQMTLESLQKNQNDNKSKTENTHQMMISQMESKYTSKIKDLNEQQANTITDLKNKNKELERQNKQLNEKFEITSKSKQTEHGGLEKKVEKLQEERDRLLKENEDIKTERDRKFIEYNNSLDKERENYKLKLRETEGKGTKVEARQTELILNHEKDKAKWDHEKSYLLSQKEDAVDHSQRLEKRVENLLRENEKLRNDMRASKKNLYQAAANTNSYQAAMVGNKILNSLQNNFGDLKAGSSTGLTGLIGGVNKSQINDGSGTERSNLGGLQSIFAASKESKAYIGSGDKSFLGNTSMTQGAVGGFNISQNNNPLESSLIKNILLSTPSSKRSGDLQDSEMSSEDQVNKRD